MSIMERNVNCSAGTATRYLGEQIAGAYGLALGQANVARFSDGEFSPAFDRVGCAAVMYSSSIHLRAIR